ncbi:MAG: hypothetical protein KGS61_08325 [Verrucomicrobia bacterium]|nr:hypothetical protein [Verrucomicrobiota bacterium]
MKNSTFLRGLAPLAASALLLPTAARAQTTSYTGTGWVNQVFAPGIYCVNAAGQVLVRGVAYMLRAECTDPRLTGRHTAFSDGYLQADGSTVMYGTAYYEVGTWAGTNFTPNGGIWEMKYNGLLQTNNSLQVTHVGYGSGGTIDGLRLEETATRGPAANALDPTVPLFYAGTIKPPPVSTTLDAEDFTSGVQGWMTINPGYGTISLFPTNQALGMRADYRGYSPGPLGNFVHAHPSAGNYNWSLADGQTLECQADLVRVSEDSTNFPYLVVGGDQGLYFVSVSHQSVGLYKFTPATTPNMACFWVDTTVQLPLTNIVIHLALTRDKANLIITAHVLDKAHQNAVLFERAFVDTPAVEATLDTTQYRALTKTTTITLVPDPGPPVFAVNGWHGGSAGGGVGVNQDSDGNQPPVEAVWDNFSLRLSDEPPLSIAPAVQVTWTVPAGVNYSVEGAPSVQGPWLPVQYLTPPGMSHITIPANSPAQFFRLIQAP